MKRSKIMIIEDDPVIQGELQTLLNGNGYTTLGVRNFSAVTEQIQDEKPHLILLDIKLPGENGFALCSKIRTFSEVPIIFVTSCNTDMDELNSIMLGGDAFITKPYNTAILLAKIASLLKKVYPTQQREQIVYGDAVLHLESSSLDYHGQSVELTKNELKILYYLFKNGGKICSRGDMIEYLWDNQLYVDDNALSVPFPVSWTVKMKKKQKETQDILSYHSQAAGCSDKARAKASGGRQPIEECGRTGL